MNTWIKLALVVAVVGGGAAWWLRARNGDAASIAFRTAEVQRGDVTQTVTGSGTLSAITTVSVGSQVSGNISKLYVDYNDAVKKGQLIAEIEPSTYEARLVQAEADLLSAQTALELKRLNAQRATELRAQSLIAQADYDDAQAGLRQQEAAAKKAEASVKSARLDVERCKITSPIDGVVLKRAVDLGQTVQASFSAPELFTLAQDLRKMEIEASISEADIGAVEAGQAVTFTVDAFSGRTFRGTVRQVRNNSTTTSNVVTYPTIITVDNEDQKLRPGMTANVVITTAKRTNVVRVPNAALRYRPSDAIEVLAAAEPAVEEPPSLDQLPDEVRQRVLANFDKDGDGQLDADERKEMQATRRIRMGEGNGTGGSMEGGDAAGAPPSGANGGGGMRVLRAPGSGRATGGASPATMYVLPAGGSVTSGAAKLQAVNVRIGVSDSAYTEIVSGLQEGSDVVTGVRSAQAATAGTSTAGSNNPFAPRPPTVRKSP